MPPRSIGQIPRYLVQKAESMQTHNLLLVTFLSSVSMPLADEAMKLVMESLCGLRYKLQMMDVAINGLTNIF